jgi:protein associated with RNAse G/E
LSGPAIVDAVTGEIILRRQFQRGTLLGRVWATRLAADDEHGLWLWIPHGSQYFDVAAADGRSFREVPFREWSATAKEMRELNWSTNLLMLHPREGAYSLWFSFTPEGAFAGWYVNLEEPVIRWRDGELSGVDTVDQDLDIVVAPDRTWRWKDEEEFAEHLEYPDGYWVSDEAAVRAEGERVVKLIDAGEFPFDGSGTGFRPDPAWSGPVQMPVGWDRPRAT